MLKAMKTSGSFSTADAFLGRFVFHLLLLSIVVTPWLFGGVWMRVQSVLALALAILLVGDICLQLRQGNTQAWLPTLYLPLLLGIGLGIFQLFRFSEHEAVWLAPYAFSMRAALVGEAGPTSVRDTDNGLTERTETRWTRSIYPPSTRANLVLLILATATCFLAGQYGSSSQTLWLFCVAMTVCGIVLAFFALVQKLTWNDQLYWQFPLRHGGQLFGPFVNRNNGGGFLNLCLAGSIGMLIWMTWQGSNLDQEDQSTHSERRARTATKYFFVTAFWRWLAQLNGQQLLVLGGMVCIASGVFASGSRGSILALCGGAGAIAALFFFRRGSRGIAIGLLAIVLVAILLMSSLGFRDDVESRFRQLWDPETRELYVQGGRWANWKDALRAVPHFLWAGSGLDTYRFAYMPWQNRVTGEIWHYHAENQYLQALCDAGLVGLLLLLVAIVLVAGAICVLLRKPGRAETVAAAVGAYALTSQIIGGSFDFGLYIPSNTLLMAAICGVVVARAGHVLARSQRRWLALKVDRVTAVAVSSLLFVGCAVGSVELYRAADVEQALDVAGLEQIRDEHDDGQLCNWINQINRAVRRRWDDADAHRALAELWIQRYRVATYRRLEQQAGDLEDEEIWDRASLWQLHGSVREAERRGETSTVEQFRQHPDVQAYLKPAWEHAQLARDSCPWFPHTHYMLAELCSVVGNEPDDDVHLARALRLAPSDTTLLYWCGNLELASGRVEQACANWQQSLVLSSQHETEIMNRARNTMDFETVINTVIPQSPAAMFRFAHHHWPTDIAVQQSIATIVLQRLEEGDSTEPETHYLRGWALDMLGRSEEALVELRMAVTSQPAKVQWRFDFARLLHQQDRLDEAIEQLKQCVLAEPDSREYREFLNKARSIQLRLPGTG